MNYSDFSFWWILLLFCVPFFTARAVGKSFNLWRGTFDAVGIASLSLLLFYNASAKSFIIFTFTILFNYAMVKWMLRYTDQRAKLIATIAIVVDIGILAYFKYLTFFVEDIFGLAVGGVGRNWQSSFPLPVFSEIPPGVSFYTFQMVAFIVDSLQKKNRKKPIGFLDYINFVAFFPQIVAGPIERRVDLFPQIENFRFKFSLENFDQGFRWLSLGFFMKFVLGDNMSPYIDKMLTETGNPWIIWFAAFLFTLRIYFDFAGYSFMALGIARFLGVKLTVNFLAPYTSISINEFWRRWHVTLSTWFRDYVFIPLMGAQKQWAAFYLFLTFTLSGLWHGAAWNFILWGAYHGGLLLVLRYLGRPFDRVVSRYVAKPQIIAWALTFGSIILGCLFFMETNISRLAAKMQSLITPWNYSLSNLRQFLSSYSINEGVVLIVLLILAISVLLLEQIAVWQQKFEYELLLSGWVPPVLLGLTVLLAANTPSKFIYFAF
ncbi:MAG: MBOAT family O-acyltransferase [Cyanobacteriota bacterium]|nr:MBOAT family O-acyltransferase [Cyanobacteriota bacterium]